MTSTKNYKKTDVLIIGSGPAGIGAAIGAAKKHKKVTVLEAGRVYKKRFCPVDVQRNCRGCGKICNVISGFGGCIHYGDGAKLSKFPSGRRLFNLIGEDISKQLSDKAIDIMFNNIDISKLEFKNLIHQDLPFLMKDYSVAKMTETMVRTLVENMYDLILSHDLIDMEFEHRVIKIEPIDGFFEVVALNKKKTEMVYRAEKVVVAVGRYGQNWWRQELRRLNLIHKTPSPSVGLRFECPQTYLSQASKLHRDFKTTVIKDDIKIKTFCFCAGTGGGQIKFTDYGDYTLLDGHVTPDANLPTANFALLAQLKDHRNEPRNYAWIEDNLISPYKSLRSDRPGKPVIQWYSDFKQKIITCKNFNDFYQLTGYRPSLSDYSFSNLATILPEKIHTAFCAVFEDLLHFFASLDSSFTFHEAVNKFSVIGLELESLWDELSVSPNMETSQPNLYACGDCAGIAQGILQSFVSGLATTHTSQRLT